MTKTEAPGRIDGRTARAERTRAAIVEAHLALIDEGDLRPTAERIAERAGVSLRALWTNFKDMETLFAASGERVLQLQATASEPIDPGLPLARRVDEFCRQRARLLELVGPSARAAGVKEPFSPQLRRNKRLHLDRVSGEIDLLFAHELDMAGRAREQLLQGLLVATTWSAWSLLRDGMSLDVDAARAVMARTVTALLSAAVNAGFDA